MRERLKLGNLIDVFEVHSTIKTYLTYLIERTRNANDEKAYNTANTIRASLEFNFVTQQILFSCARNSV